MSVSFLADAAQANDACDLRSLDANCLQHISRCCTVSTPAASRDKRNPTLVRLALVSQALRSTLNPLVQQMHRRHRLRKQGLTKMAQSLGAAGSWNHQLKRVRQAAQSRLQPEQCQGGCGETLKASRMLCLVAPSDTPDERRTKFVCARCARAMFALPENRGSVGLFPLGIPFGAREEVTDDYGEGGEAARRLRAVLMASGYGFADCGDQPLCDADCPVLCDLLVSGLGRRCMWLDLSACALGDAGVTAIARGLPACMALLHLNLNGNPVGNQGVAALASALTPKAEPCGESPRGGRVTPCVQMRWLYLVLNNLGDAGATALARALTRLAVPRLECLWCCGAFSAESETGDAREGFRALTRACEAREPAGLTLELEHGLPWGM